MMLVGIDATGLYGPRTGIENYIIHIVNNVVKADTLNDYIVYCRDVVPDEFVEINGNVTYKTLNISNRKIYQQAILPLVAAKDRIECMFFPGGTMSIFNSSPTVLTVHDIFPFVIPSNMPKYHKYLIVAKINNFYWKQINIIGAKKASKIISVSKSTKSDLIDAFGVDKSKINVIYEAMSDGLKRENDSVKMERFRHEYGLNKPYLLCVGTGAYKNLPGAINAFFELKTEQIFSKLDLVITGPKERLTEDTKALIYDSEYSSNVRFLGFFPQDKLSLLYSNSEIFLFPSFYEGFGIPILEAFTCGVPVITSNVSSMPEVAGDAACFVDPLNPMDIAAKLRSVLIAPEKREAMVRKGYKQFQNFSWQKAAVETINVFNNTK